MLLGFRPLLLLLLLQGAAHGGASCSCSRFSLPLLLGQQCAAA
jgi:hypothetical protein